MFQINGIRHENRYIISDIVKIQRIIRDYYKQQKDNKFDNLERQILRHIHVNLTELWGNKKINRQITNNEF